RYRDRRRLAAFRALRRGGFRRYGAQRLGRPTAVIDQHDVATRDADVLEAVAVRRWRLRRAAEREPGRVLGWPFDLDSPRAVRSAVERIDRRDDLRQPHGLTVRRIGVGRLAGLRAEYFLEDQDVPDFQLQRPLACRRIGGRRWRGSGPGWRWRHPAV